MSREVCCVVGDGVVCDAKEEAEPVEKMPSEAEFGCSHDVFCLLCVFVMREIVTRNISRDRMTISKRKKNLHPFVGSTIGEHGTMNAIVNRDSSEERKETGERERKEGIETMRDGGSERREPKMCKKKKVDGEEREGSKILDVLQVQNHHDQCQC